MAAKKSRKSLEHTLWDAVDKSRGNQEPSECISEVNHG